MVFLYNDYFIKLCPVISPGTSIPNNVNIVGAISESHHSFSILSCGSQSWIYHKGTKFVVCEVFGAFSGHISSQFP